MERIIGKFFALLLPCLIIFTVFVVVSRYVFGSGQAGVQEIILYIHSLICLGCAGWALLEDEHVRVDIFYRNNIQKYKKIINLIGLLCFMLPTIIIISIYSFDFILKSWASLEGSTEPGGLPIKYIHKTFILIFPISLMLAGFSLLRKLWK